MSTAIDAKIPSLGSFAEEVLRAAYTHPGEMDKQVFGYDYNQGFEFFLHVDGLLYKRVNGGVGMLEVSMAEESRMYQNLIDGNVEFYLVRPVWGIAPYPLTERKVIHARQPVKEYS